MKTNYRKSKNIKSRIYFLIFIACMGTLTLVLSDFGLRDLFYIKQQKENLNTQIQSLYKQQIALQDEINKLLEDTSYVEKVARERFLMVKPGEKVFRVIENKTHQ